MTMKKMVFHLADVLYVGVAQLRLVDSELVSLVNVNTREEYDALERREDSSEFLYPGAERSQ